MKKTVKIDPHKRYKIPVQLSVVRHGGRILIISIETACWIVLNNDEQLHFFELLKEYNLSDAINYFEGLQSDVLNVIIQLEARKFESMDITKSPNQIMQIYLTNNCNMRCPHCYMSAGVKGTNELKTAEVLNTLKLFRESGGQAVTFSGGEITTRTDLYEIIKYGYNQGLKVELLTNGTLWSDDLINKISPLVFRVQISIDGYSEEENAKVRGKGYFDKALRTLDQFITKGVKTELAITPFYDCSLKGKVNEYAEFGTDLRNKYKAYDFKVKFTTGLLDGRDLVLDEAIKSDYSKIMTNVMNSYYGEDVTDYAFIISHKKRLIFDNCTYGCLNISSTGDVYACSRIPSIKPFSNIRETDFTEIINLSKKAQGISNIINLKPCNECDLMYICGGGCRIKFFKEFSECDNLEALDAKSISPRSCDKETKDEFYDLMIRTNDRIFL